MRSFGILDIVGPRMIGPSSSHTAGAARLAYVAGHIAGYGANFVRFILYRSFKYTAKGHGTDRALLAGVMGMPPDDDRLRDAFRIADDRGLKYEFITSDDDVPHANTARIQIYKNDFLLADIVGASIGGGNVLITNINGIEVELTGEYPTLIVRHYDAHGVIAEVTGALADDQINIAFMRVYRQSKGNEAYMIIETDQKVPHKTLSHIAGLRPEIAEVFAI